MTALASEVDVAVIGAGAAGIGAARRLVEAGQVSLLVMEGREPGRRPRLDRQCRRPPGRSRL
jgi:cation diffusion facilitator CzcD-associated flavoprotein CzcO